MKRMSSGSPDRLDYHEGFGWSGCSNVCTGLFGLGISIFLSSIAPPGVGWGCLVSGGIASLYLLSGLVRMARQSSIEIDRRKGTIEGQEGSLLPTYRKFRIADFRGVEVASRTISYGRGDRETVYPITLLGLGTREELVAPRDEGGSRRAAEEIARYLGYDLVDATSGEPRHYRAGDVGVPLGKRLRARGHASIHAVSPPPRGSRLAFHRAGQRLVVEVPPPSGASVLQFPFLLLLGFGVVGAALGYGIAALVANAGNQAMAWDNVYFPGSCVTAALGLLGFVFGLLNEMPGMWVRTTIQADESEVVVRREGLFSEEVRANAGEVREALADGLVTCDRDVSFHLVHLSDEERAWLRQAIQAALVGGQPRPCREADVPVVAVSPWIQARLN